MSEEAPPLGRERAMQVLWDAMHEHFPILKECPLAEASEPAIVRFIQRSAANCARISEMRHPLEKLLRYAADSNMADLVMLTDELATVAGVYETELASYRIRRTVFGERAGGR